MSRPPTATMRVNVYAEALHPVEPEYDDIKKYGPRVLFHEEQVKSLPFKHRAIRILIGERIIHSDSGSKDWDDDTAAVTFWYSDNNQRKILREIFQRALDELDRPEAKY